MGGRGRYKCQAQLGHTILAAWYGPLSFGDFKGGDIIPQKSSPGEILLPLNRLREFKLSQSSRNLLPATTAVHSLGGHGPKLALLPASLLPKVHFFKYARLTAIKHTTHAQLRDTKIATQSHNIVTKLRVLSGATRAYGRS